MPHLQRPGVAASGRAKPSPFRWALAIALLAPGVARSDDAAPKASPTDLLERTWIGYPEWLAMLGEILSENQPAPGQGWYRKGVSKTRYTWEAVAEKLDRDRDGKIERAECPAVDADFARLDRNRDGTLTAADFDFHPNDPKWAATEALASDSFALADRDGNGRVPLREFETFFAYADTDPVYRILLANPREQLAARLDEAEAAGVSYLSLADFQEGFSLAPRPASAVSRMIRTPKPAVIPKETLFRSFLRQEIGAWGPGPEVGSLAPDFTLSSLDGEEVTLSKRTGRKPLVLIFGNYTCDRFRGHAGSLEKLNALYKDRADFLIVYTNESHSTDGWVVPANVKAGISLGQPRGFEERVGVARTCQKALSLGQSILIDGMDNRVARTYSGLPSRIYLIDTAGRVAFKSGRGPFGFKPAELEQSLILSLAIDARAGL